MIDLIFLITIISLIFVFALGFFTFLKNYKSKDAFYFFILTIVTDFWIVSNYISNIVKTETEAILWAKITYTAAACIPFVFILFAFNFPKKIFFKKSNLELLFGIPCFGIILLIFFDEIIGKEVKFIPPTVYVSLGKNFLVYIIYFLLYIVIAFVILQIKLRKSSGGLERIQLKFVFIFTLIAIIIGTLFNLLLYGIKEIGYLTHFGPIGTLPLVIGLTYAITKHHLFGIVPIVTEILVGIIGLLLIIQIFMAPTILWKIINGILFVLFCFFGYLLIKATFREIKRRQEIEKIDKAKSEFISIASHQLRTPLTAVKGYISI